MPRRPTDTPDDLWDTAYRADYRPNSVTVHRMRSNRIVVAETRPNGAQLPPLDADEVERLIAALAHARMHILPATRWPHPKEPPRLWPATRISAGAYGSNSRWGAVELTVGHSGLGCMTFPIALATARRLFDDLWRALIEQDALPLSAGWAPKSSNRRHNDDAITRRTRAANDNGAAPPP